MADYTALKTRIANTPVQGFNTPVRRSSTYTLDIATPVPNEACDAMQERSRETGITLAASGVDRDRAFVRFRASSDEEAVDIAAHLTDLEGVLHTGYGVNRRDVAR